MFFNVSIYEVIDGSKPVVMREGIKKDDNNSTTAVIVFAKSDEGYG
jgi:hypothetical protein